MSEYASLAEYRETIEECKGILEKIVLSKKLGMGDEGWACSKAIQLMEALLHRVKLEERQSKGCEHCKDGVYHDVLGSPCRYNNCPMCGRELPKKGGGE